MPSRLSTVLPFPRSRALIASLLLCASTTTMASAQANAPAAPGDSGRTPVETRELAREIFADLISRRTAAGHGQVPAMAEALARRFLDAGFDKDDVLVTPYGETAYLRVRFPGADSKLAPIAFLAHMDVVDALREDWSIEPYQLLEQDGYFYGRGTHDNKAGITALTVTFLRLRQEGFVPERDLVLAFSGDEETRMLTTREMAKTDPYLKRAEFALNADAGGGSLNDQGEPTEFVIQAAEKTYATFEVAIRNRGGHSSLPRDDNAIYQLARALIRLEAYDFPNSSNDTTRGYFRAVAEQQDKAVGKAMLDFAEDPTNAAAAEVLAADPGLVGLIRTTCVATMLTGGHAENALPQLARATVNCRIFPDTSVEQVQATLAEVMEDSELEITVLDEPLASPVSPLRDDLLETLDRVLDKHAPGTAIVPYMSAYGTDGKELRAAGIPTYGVAGLFTPSSDVRAHGRDERIPITAFYDSLAYWYDLMKEISH